MSSSSTKSSLNASIKPKSQPKLWNHNERSSSAETATAMRGYFPRSFANVHKFTSAYLTDINDNDISGIPGIPSPTKLALSPAPWPTIWSNRSSPKTNTKPLRSALVIRDPNSGHFCKGREFKVKKKVRFTPDTVDYSRETKPYKYHNLFKPFVTTATLPFAAPGMTSVRASEYSSLQAQFRPSTIANDGVETLRPFSPPKLPPRRSQSQGSSGKPPPIGSRIFSPKSANTPETEVKQNTLAQNVTVIMHKQDRPQTPTAPLSLSAQSPQPHSESQALQFENDYVAFTHARKTYDYLSKRFGPSAIRARRLFQIGQELQEAHVVYNSLNSSEARDRDRFLVNQIIVRYITGLDLALTENYTGFALELTHAMADTTSHMCYLYSTLFYNPDGTKIDLPIQDRDQDQDDGGGSGGAYLQMLASVIGCLNRLSENRPRHENQFYSAETLLVKLLLEMITLTICPVKSVMFRAVLEVVPGTAFAAYDALLARAKIVAAAAMDKTEYDEKEDPNRNKGTPNQNGNSHAMECSDGVSVSSSSSAASSELNTLNIQDEAAIKWVNNSALYQDYVAILRSLGLADKVGALGHVPSFSRSAVRARIDGVIDGDGKRKTRKKRPTSTNGEGGFSSTSKKPFDHNYDRLKLHSSSTRRA